MFCQSSLAEHWTQETMLVAFWLVEESSSGTTVSVADWTVEAGWLGGRRGGAVHLVVPLLLHILISLPSSSVVKHGWQRTGNGQGKKFFKVREKSENFTPSQEKFKSLREVREKGNFKGTNLFIANSAMFLCKQECELSTDVDSSHSVRWAWRPLPGLICEFF